MKIQRETPVLRDLADEPQRILAALEASLGAAGPVAGPAPVPTPAA